MPSKVVKLIAVAANSKMSDSKRYDVAKKVTIVNAVLNSILALFKIIVGYFGHSYTLLTDGIHSLSDLISDALVLIAAKIGGQIPDKEHPYGHQRIETIAAMIIAIILLIVGLVIIYETMHLMLGHQSREIHGIAVISAALISIIIKEGLYRYTLYAGKKVHSNLLIANAYHNRSDVYVSGLVLLSVMAHLFGIPYADNIGAGIIALLILKTSIQLFMQGIKELIDTGVDQQTLKQLNDCIQSITGVVSVHQLRTRLHGGNIFVDTHIIVSPFISVSEGHHIGEKLHWQLMQNFPQIADVTVHIDPENDETKNPSLNLPSRAELIPQLQKIWEKLPGFSKIESIRLHYLDGKIYVEVYWLQNTIAIDQWQVMAQTYPQACQIIHNLIAVNLFMRV